MQQSFAEGGAEIQWQRSIGGNDWDVPHSIQLTTDGGYILGGSSQSGISGDKTESSNGGKDYWIVKTDSEGNIQWQNSIGGSGEDYLFSVQGTFDGGYLLGGVSSSNISGDKTENSNGGFDYWIVKTDSVGIIQWQNTIGGNSDDMLSTALQVADGGYILGGYSNSGISGDKTEICIGIIDYWIIKIDSAGSIQWQNNIGGDSWDFFQTLVNTNDGGFLLGGYSASNISGDKTEMSQDWDYWIVKIDAAGTIQWQNTIGGDHGDKLHALLKTSDGGYILGGESESDISGDKTESSRGSYDYWIIKTDSGGNLLWQRTLGGINSDQLSSICQTTDGGYVLAGQSYSEISGDKTENNISDSLDYWVLKLDSARFIEWQNTLGGHYDEVSCDILQATDENFILLGDSYSNIGGDRTEADGNGDYWLIKLYAKYNFIKGKAYIDSNSNGVLDSGELPYRSKRVVEEFTGRFSYIEQTGVYTLPIFDTGSFQVSVTPLNYYNIVPLSHSAYFPQMQSVDSLNDFSIQPAVMFNDLCITLNTIGAFRAGRNVNYMISYENAGTTTLNGTIIFFLNSNISYISSTPVPTSVSIDSVVWNTGVLQPFQSGSILLTVVVDSTAAISSVIHASVRIEPVVGDVEPICNYATISASVTGAYDPNEIRVDRDTIFTTELSNPPYLQYIINFQNTGNDTAFNVRILNPIDSNRLQLSTLEFLASSDPVNVRYKPWERNMEFTFQNILLPDSNVNEPASHGFVSYRVKPKAFLMAGDAIPSTAYIYFDLNAPVKTNTAITEIIFPVSVEELPKLGQRFTVFPNPLVSQATIAYSNPKHESFEFSLFDMTGRLVESFTSTSEKFILEKGKKPAGLYLIRLTNNKTGEPAFGKIVISD